MKRWIWICCLTLLAAPALAAPGELVLGGRFRVTAAWRTAAGTTCAGIPVPLTAESGYFHFFDPANPEVFVKLVDACAAPFDRFWFFAAGLTDVEVELVVEDTLTGEERRYTSPQGVAFAPIQDTDAFATCDVEGCGRGTAAEIAATPRADVELERLAIYMGNAITAGDALYARVVAEVGAVRAQHPELRSYDFVPRAATDTILLGYDAATGAQIRNGTYHEWDCLNAWYGGEPQVLSSIDVTILRFDGNFKPELLVADYAALGLHAGQDFISFFPPFFPARLCGVVQGTAHHYFFRDAPSGSAPDRQFVVAAPGAPAVERTPVDLAMMENCLASDTPTE
jgi:hypothetical protein